jgi:hypothetical protein
MAGKRCLMDEELRIGEGKVFFGLFSAEKYKINYSGDVFLWNAVLLVDFADFKPRDCFDFVLIEHHDSGVNVFLKDAGYGLCFNCKLEVQKI